MLGLEMRGALDAQLKTLAETGEKLRTETGALVTALRKPNARGRWGQMQLRNVVELAGMLKHCDFTEQSSYTSDEATVRPDLDRGHGHDTPARDGRCRAGPKSGRSRAGAMHRV